MSAGSSLRLVLFVDPALESSMTLLGAHLKAAAERDDIEIAAIVDTAAAPSPALQLPRSLAVRGVHRLCNPTSVAAKTQTPLLSTCARLARRRRVAVLAPRGLGINDPRFVETIAELKADAGISLMVAQIFRAPLLNAVAMPLNYHPGQLPHYRGIAATGWSIYNGESESGFSFHRMVEQVDRGPILLQGAVPLGPRSGSAQTERAKSKAASSQLHAWFDVLSSGDCAGVEQAGGSGYTRADERAIRTIAQPSELTLHELELRLRSFEWLYLMLAGRYRPVTALRRTGRLRHNHELSFRTADDIAVEVSRLMYLPPVLHRALGPLYGSAYSPPAEVSE